VAVSGGGIFIEEGPAFCDFPDVNNRVIYPIESNITIVIII